LLAFFPALNFIKVPKEIGEGLFLCSIHNVVFLTSCVTSQAKTAALPDVYMNISSLGDLRTSSLSSSKSVDAFKRASYKIRKWFHNAPLLLNPTRDVRVLGDGRSAARSSMQLTTWRAVLKEHNAHFFQGSCNPHSSMH
jgi:hypothetical protein